MKWSPRGADPDVIDQRGGGGGRRGIALGGGGLGLGGIIVVVLLQLLGGGGGGSAFDIGTAFDQQVGGGAQGGTPIPAAQDPERDLKDFSAYVFGDTQDRWAAIFAKSGDRYEHAKLVLYRSAVSTGCGDAASAVGPFYCPADRRVYLDLSFYKDLGDQLGASGDFAWAYVIAHEMGHHVQQQLGTDRDVEAARRSDPSQANALSVRQELQADCYAGVWAHGVYRAGQLQPGDIEEAFTAAEAVGDDRLQRRAGGSVRPDTFTHGTSAQRRRWFTTGESTGDPSRCDTFAAATL
jgi:predicted metalloprotease